MAKFKTHYDNLQVSPRASDAVIRAAYRSLAQKYHPDKFEGMPTEAERVMKILNEAYANLIDPAKRREHDAWILQVAEAERVEAQQQRARQMEEAKRAEGQQQRARQAESSESAQQTPQQCARQMRVEAEQRLVSQTEFQRRTRDSFFFFVAFAGVGYFVGGIWGAIVGGLICLFRRTLLAAVVKILPAAAVIAVIGGGFIIVGNANNKSPAPNQTSNTHTSMATPPATHLTDSQQTVMSQLTEKIGEGHKRQDILAQELSAKFAALDMDNVLTPAALTTANGIIRSRATIQRFSELIAERRRLAVSFFDEGEHALRSSGLDRVILQTELDAFNTTKNHNLALIGDLENAQRGIMISALKIIDLCEHSLGRLGVRDGGILFQSQEQVDTYQTQLGLVQQYAQREEIAMAAFIAFSKQTRPR